MPPPPAESPLKRKILNPQTREVIANVYKFMKTEASLGNPVRLQQVQQRVSLATGVSHSTVKRIVRQLKVAEATGETVSFVASSKNSQQVKNIQKTQSNRIKRHQEEILEPTVEVFVTENCLSNFTSDETYQSEDNPLDPCTSADEEVKLEHTIIDGKHNEISSLPVQVFIKEETCDEDDGTQPDKKCLPTGQYLRNILLNGTKQ